MRHLKTGISIIGLMVLSLVGYALTVGSTELPAGATMAASFEGLNSVEPTAAAETFAFDPAHSTIGFSVRHLVINDVPGKFKDYKGLVQYDSTDLSKSSVEFTAQVTSIDTGVQARDNHLRTADFFDVAKYPEMIFKSTKIERKGKDAYLAKGTFTLKGVSKEITIPFKLYGPIKDPWGKMRVGIDASLVINRQDYGVAYNQMLEGGGLVVSNDVKIQLNIEAVKQ